MKIFLPFEIKGIGGTATFAQKFKTGMEAKGHIVSFTFTPDYDVLFLIVQCPLKYLIDAKRHKKKIVQRLDGTYYWSVSGLKFPLLNAKATYIRHLFTDFTIYQSCYSQESANRFLGKKINDHHAIIYNGVDSNLFSPVGTKKITRRKDETVVFTASAFRRKDQIDPLVKTIEIAREKYGVNFHLYIGGTFTGRVSNYPNLLKKMPYVTLLGKINNHDLPGYERSSDVFICSHLNPPCPNNIIEALAAGLPICGINDGAMPELVKDGVTGKLLQVQGTGYWKERTIDYDRFAENLYAIVTSKEAYRTQSRASACEKFSLEQMIVQYELALGALI